MSQLSSSSPMAELSEVFRALPLIGTVWSHPEPGDDDTPMAPQEDQELLEMRVMTPETMVREARDLYPGRLVLPHGLIPFGECLLGTGDPYFLTPADRLSDSWMVSVPHDCTAGDWQGRIEEIARFYDFFRKATAD